MTEPAAEEVDRAVQALVRAGNIDAAAEKWQNWLDLDGNKPSAAQWLQLAGLRRALQQPRRALDAVYRALALSPFDFTALVMRASLLVRLGESAAGLAWAEAIAQRPEGQLPAPMAKAVEEGEKVRAAWMAARAETLAHATARSEAMATEDERWRIKRFRDNIIRKTQIYHSAPTHFHFPGLVEREFHPRERFPWLSTLEAATDDIRAEMLGLLHSDRADILPYVQYQEHEALAQWRSLNNSKDWSALHLYRQGESFPDHVRQCPRTIDVLSQCMQPDIPGASPNAMFSLLAPNTTIPPHVGVNNARLVCHLPLTVPGGCWFRVGAEKRLWREGEALVFDDTIEHEAANPSSALRVVLIFDVWHPDVTALEKQAICAAIMSENIPCQTL